MSERAPLEKRCKKGQGLVEISCEQGLFNPLTPERAFRRASK